MFAQLLLQHVQCMLSQLSTSHRIGTFLLCARVCVCVWKNARSTFFHCISKNDSSYRQADRQAHSIICLLHRHATTYVEQQQNYIHIIASEVVTHRPPTTIATTTIRFVFSNSFSGIKRALDNKRSRPVSQADGQTGKQTASTICMKRERVASQRIKNSYNTSHKTITRYDSGVESGATAESQ